MRTIKAVIGSSALAMLMLASSAIGESRTHRLKGDFAFTGSAVCVNSSAIITPISYTPPPGFDANLAPIGPSFVNTFSIQGVRTFNGDGTGSVAARAVLLGNPGSANPRDISAQFTYSVAVDGTVTIKEGPTDTSALTGPSAGQRFRITDTPTLVGVLSSDGKSLTYATFNPGVEVVTQVVPAPEQVVTKRICHRSRVGIRISKDPRSGWQEED